MFLIRVLNCFLFIGELTCSYQLVQDRAFSPHTRWLGHTCLLSAFGPKLGLCCLALREYSFIRHFLCLIQTLLPMTCLMWFMRQAAVDPWKQWTETMRALIRRTQGACRMQRFMMLGNQISSVLLAYLLHLVLHLVVMAFLRLLDRAVSQAISTLLYLLQPSASFEEGVGPLAWCVSKDRLSLANGRCK